MCDCIGIWLFIPAAHFSVESGSISFSHAFCIGVRSNFVER